MESDDALADDILGGTMNGAGRGAEKGLGAIRAALNRGAAAEVVLMLAGGGGLEVALLGGEGAVGLGMALG